jgi:hydroxymethylglutaryl-CoA reductase (NADPH)
VSTDHRHLGQRIESAFREQTEEELSRRLTPKPADPSPKVPGGSRVTPQILDERWQLLYSSPK